MMKNKILIKLIVPELDSEFDVFIPVNEVVWKIEKLLIKAINDLINGDLGNKKNFVILNKITGQRYNKNDVIINTDIRNATELVLISLEN